MKKALQYLILLFSLTITAQTATTYVSGLLYTVGLEIKDDTLYAILQGNGAGNKIVTIDITNPNPVAVDFVTNLSANPFAMLMDGNRIYFTTLVGDLFYTEIDDPTHNVVLMSSGLQRCRGLAIKNNYLYISSFDAGKIMKINLNDTYPTTPTDVFTGLYLPRQIRFKGDELYIGNFTNNEYDSIIKINVTDSTPTMTTVVSGLRIPDQLRFINNELYFIQSGSQNKLSKIDITESFPPTITDVVIEISNIPEGFVFHGDDIYIAEYYLGVSKFSPETASVKEFDKNSIAVYPNPTTDKLTITTPTTIKKIEVYNVLGKKVLEKINTKTLHLGKLPAGIYMLKIHGKKTISSKKVIVI